MSKRSTAFRLSFYISTAIISVLLIVIFIVYKSSHNLIENDIEKSAVTQSMPVVTEIRKNVVSTQELTKNIARQIPYFAAKGDIEHLTRSIISNYIQLQAIHVNLKKNIFPDEIINYSAYRENDSIIFLTSSDQIAICEEELSQSNKITSQGISGWTEPFICDASHEPVSMYCYPIKIGEAGNEKEAGYVMIELSLTFLNKLIQDINTGISGFSFLISSEGTYLTHPQKEWILNHNIKNLSDSVYHGKRNDLNRVLEGNTSGYFVAYPRLLNHKKSWVYYTHIPENNWALIFVLPFSELYSDVWMLLFKLIIVSLAGIIAIFFLVSYISKRLMNPLAQIASEIHEFSSAGRLEVSKNEVETLEKSYALIQAWYNKFSSESEKNKQSSKHLQRELEQASEIINSIIPTGSPELKGAGNIEIFSAYKPVNIIGGDFYDYFLLDEDHLLIVIGDVSGKGISAAIFMGVAHTLLRSKTSEMTSKKIVETVNKELFKKNQHQYFLTLFVGVLDLNTGFLNYCNAAHTTSMVLRNNGEIVELKGSHGLPLGLYTNRKYDDDVTKLNENDVLFIYTDGITETIDVNGNLFTEKRLKKILLELINETPENIIKEVETKTNLFRGRARQVDDYSMVALKYRP
ncbi:MAG: SpoIIE family protein phosphatase [Prolixibacteraceae bacterium]|nr:SpoIIE family protein phosphatase [Prolixibacteraceae bacterium]